MKKEIVWHGNTISYQKCGNGNPVVLVHGFGETSKVWNSTRDYLQNQFTVLIPDLPGTGSSPLLEKTSIENLAETVNAIIEAEKFDRITLIGHSMGGYIALAFLEKYGTKVKGLGLFHSTAFADSEEKIANRKKGIEFIKNHGAAAFIESTSANLFSSISKKEKPELIQQVINDGKQLGATTLIAFTEAMMVRPNRSHLLKNSKIPTLFIIGEEDNAVPKQDTLKQTHLPEISYIHILFSSGHMGMLEEPEKAHQIVLNFIHNCYQ